MVQNKRLCEWIALLRLFQFEWNRKQFRTEFIKIFNENKSSFHVILLDLQNLKSQKLPGLVTKLLNEKIFVSFATFLRSNLCFHLDYKICKPNKQLQLIKTLNKPHPIAFVTTKINNPSSSLSRIRSVVTPHCYSKLIARSQRPNNNQSNQIHQRGITFKRILRSR